MTEKFGYFIKTINNTFEKYKNKDMEEFDITSQQFSIIRFLSKNKDNILNQKDIENEFNLSKATTAGLLKRLSLKGYIKREISSKDSRCNNIIITDKCFSFIEEITRRVNNIKSIMLDGLNEEEKSNLMTYLEKIMCNIKKEK